MDDKKTKMKMKDKILQKYSEKASDQTVDSEYDYLKQHFRKIHKCLKNLDSTINKQKKGVIQVKRFKELRDDLNAFYDDESVLQFSSNYSQTISSLDESLKEFVNKQLYLEQSMEMFMKRVGSIKRQMEERQSKLTAFDKAKLNLRQAEAKRDPSKNSPLEKIEKLEKKYEEAKNTYEKINDDVKSQLKDFVSQRYRYFDNMFKTILNSQMNLFSNILENYQKYCTPLISITPPLIQLDNVVSLTEDSVFSDEEDQNESSLILEKVNLNQSEEDKNNNQTQRADISKTVSSSKEDVLDVGNNQGWLAVSKPASQIDHRQFESGEIKNNNLSIASPRGNRLSQSEPADSSIEYNDNSSEDSHSKSSKKDKKEKKPKEERAKKEKKPEIDKRLSDKDDKQESFLANTRQKNPQITAVQAKEEEKSTPAIYPIFGRHLNDICGRNPIPQIVKQCIDFLSQKNVLIEEGLLRQSGSKATIDKLKSDFDEGKEVSFHAVDPHAIAGLLKSFFRELPEPIIPVSINDQMAAVIAQQNDPEITANISEDLLRDSIKVELVELLNKIPAVNFSVFKSLVGFLVLVAENEKKNKMGLTNILTCLTPSLHITPGIIKFSMEDKEFFFPEN